MLVLIQIERRHPITENVEGKDIALVTLDYVSILTIKKDPETGFANIVYKGGDSIKTMQSFESILTFLNHQGLVCSVNKEGYKDFPTSITNALKI